MAELTRSVTQPSYAVCNRGGMLQPQAHAASLQSHPTRPLESGCHHHFPNTTKTDKLISGTSCPHIKAIMGLQVSMPSMSTEDGRSWGAGNNSWPKGELWFTNTQSNEKSWVEHIPVAVPVWLTSVHASAHSKPQHQRSFTLLPHWTVWVAGLHYTITVFDQARLVSIWHIVNYMPVWVFESIGIRR